MQTVPAAPPTRTDEVVEEIHGHTVVDPYRWLEAADDAETVAWVAAQNAYTRSLLDKVPGREALQRRLGELMSVGAVTAPTVRGDRYFYLRREGAQNQPVLYVRQGIDGGDRILVDPNAESEEGLVTLDWWYPSWDGRLLAYGVSVEGNEWSTLYILDVDTGERLPDEIERTRYASVAWLPDGSGFYYTRYPLPGDVPPGEENYHVKVFFHALGATRDTDPQVFGDGLEAEDIPDVRISADGRWLLVGVYHGWKRSDLYLLDLDRAGAPFVPVAVGYDALFWAEIAGGTLYIHTNLDAPRYRVFRVDAGAPQRERWEEIIPEPADGVLEVVKPLAGGIVAAPLRNATSALALYDAGGQPLAEIELPVHGTVTELSGSWDGDEVFYSFESFAYPPTVFRLGPDGVPTSWAAVEAPIEPAAFEVKQEWYTSRDGTRVSMFIVHRRDLDVSTPRPTVLTGYGGFNLARTPLFERSFYPWLESGGIYVLPNLRGGSEYGEEWHRGGMLDRKQNVFDDFIAAAEYLIDRGYTEPAQLGISGRSNGGLLVGAALTQRPDLFRAVVCGVPLLDMLRYHHFLIARLWIAEYGSADNPDQFPYIYAYSPYHHVTAGTSYPAVLLFTAESDTRVDPLHARKMAALLQAANASEHPILLRVESKAGHGVGKPITKVIEEQTDVWTFLFWQLGKD
ncbi:MAG TPA: prolyl oligopeptidase family serine peptidase [Chloroflexota bacterium]|nr:prolyl oligopeptidase family serine peptidase [Chloroflexota bacterium]